MLITLREVKGLKFYVEHGESSAKEESKNPGSQEPLV